MLKFISFGSGSSGNCYFLYTEDDGLMIDVGIGIRLLKKHFHDYGLPITRIKHILLTHDHADHVKSVGSLSHDFDIPVYSTQKVHAGIGNNYCVRKKIDSNQARVIENDRTYTLGAFSITPFDVPHDSNDNVGYEIVVVGKTFCLMTDIGRVTDEMAACISRADYLVIEANHDGEMLAQGPYPQYLKDRIVSGNGHLSNKLCGEAIAQNMKETLQHVWLCHLSEENNHPELARKTVETIMRSYGIIIGNTLQLDVLKRTMPTGIFEL